MEKLEQCDSFKNLYLLFVENLSSEGQKLMREKLDGKIIFGKTRIMKKFLENKKYESKEIEGTTQNQRVCLFFTNQEKSEVEEQLKEVKLKTFIQPGQVSPLTIKLTKGTSVFTHLSSSNASYLRDLGIFVTVKEGKIFLESDHELLHKNQVVNSQQAKTLKLLGLKIGNFKVILKSKLK